jgi:hypothetical protein
MSISMQMRKSCVAAEQHHLLRQYVYFCTSKASKLSTCRREARAGVSFGVHFRSMCKACQRLVKHASSY